MKRCTAVSKGTFSPSAKASKSPFLPLPGAIDYHGNKVTLIVLNLDAVEDIVAAVLVTVHPWVLDVVLLPRLSNLDPLPQDDEGCKRDRQ